MKRTIQITVLIATLAAISGSSQEVVFQDDFKGKLGPGWSWLREDPQAWRVTEQGLEIRALPGNMWGGGNNAKNVLVRSVPDPANAEIEVSVSITNKPTEQYEQVDLVWYYADSHMVKIGQEQVDGKLCIVMGREEADKTRTIVIIPIDFHALQLRFLVAGNSIRGQFRALGTEAWRDAGTTTLPALGEPKVSFQVYQGPRNAERWARFNGFRVTRTSLGAR